MQHTVIDFGMGTIIGGLALSACWGWLWFTIGTVGLARGVCSVRVVINSLVVGLSPVLLGWGIWWMRAEAFSPSAAFFGGLFVMPLLLVGLGLRKAPDGRRAGLHMAEGMLHLKDELLGLHHECGGCGHDHGTGATGGHT
jgi:hypothetical protein